MEHFPAHRRFRDDEPFQENETRWKSHAPLVLQASRQRWTLISSHEQLFLFPCPIQQSTHRVYPAPGNREHPGGSHGQRGNRIDPSLPLPPRPSRMVLTHAAHPNCSPPVHSIRQRLLSASLYPSLSPASPLAIPSSRQPRPLVFPTGSPLA